MPDKTTPPTDPTKEAFHKSFSWLLPERQGDQHAQFYAITVDVCQGIKTCIDLAHLSNTDRDDNALPTLDKRDTESLMRLALSSSHLLAELAAKRIDRLNDCANLKSE